MYQRAPSAAVRTGGTAPLMKPEEYHEQVGKCGPGEDLPRSGFLPEIWSCLPFAFPHDVMPHQLSCPSLTCITHASPVAGFRDTMEQYSLKLKSALATIKNGLQLDAASATAQVCCGQGAQFIPLVRMVQVTVMGLIFAIMDSFQRVLDLQPREHNCWTRISHEPLSLYAYRNCFNPSGL